jgi:3-methyladenine DNA glycosylase AlkD
MPDDIRAGLVRVADAKHAAFNARLVPNINSQRILGVRMLELRRIAHQLTKANDAAIETFLVATPHRYLEEDLLHILLLNEMRDVDQFVAALEAFLPFVDNWMVSDALSPRLPSDQLPALESHIHCWLQSPDTYTARCGVILLMDSFLDELFRPEHLHWVAGVKSDDYYAHMVVGWYFATALAKQPKTARAAFFSPDALGLRLAPEARRKAVQKSLESRRISDHLKAELRQLRANLKASGDY